jgi:hypothetical protein
LPAPPVESALVHLQSGKLRPLLSLDEALKLTDEEVLARGYPLRPHPEEAPRAFRSWLQSVSMPMTEVEPHPISNPGKSHGKSKQAGPATSNNWSGFELDRTIRKVSIRPPRISFSERYDYVKAQWHVPALIPEHDQYTHSALWVGLDGDGTDDLVQAGTEQDCNNYDFLFVNITATTFYAWTEFLPQQPSEQVISGFTVNPGDLIQTEVWMGNAGSMPTLAGAFGVFWITNLTTGTTTHIYTPVGGTSVSGSEAVWIMERPTVDGVFPDLANFGSATMFDAIARKTGGGYIAYQGARNQQLSMVNGSDTLAIVTPIDATTMRFDWLRFN